MVCFSWFVFVGMFLLVFFVCLILAVCFSILFLF